VRTLCCGLTERYHTIPHNKSEVDEKEEEETNQNSNNIFVYKTENIVKSYISKILFCRNCGVCVAQHIFQIISILLIIHSHISISFDCIEMVR
jgi:ferredoxin